MLLALFKVAQLILYIAYMSPYTRWNSDLVFIGAIMIADFVVGAPPWIWSGYQYVYYQQKEKSPLKHVLQTSAQPPDSQVAKTVYPHRSDFQVVKATFVVDSSETFDDDELKELQRSEELQQARSICNADIKQYGLLWESVLKKELSAISNLEIFVSTLQSNLPGSVRQPAITSAGRGQLDVFSVEYYKELEAQFRSSNNLFEGSMRAVSRFPTCTFKIGPNKKPARAMEKASLAYNKDYSQLKDLRRACVLCPDIDTILKCARALSQKVNIVRVKNRFSTTFSAKDESAGYRDLQLNILHDTGLVWELQLHLFASEKLKSDSAEVRDALGRTGHQRYVAWREIKERC